MPIRHLLFVAAISGIVGVACGSADEGDALESAPPVSGDAGAGEAEPKPAELVETEVDGGGEVPADTCPRARVAVPPGNGLNVRETPSIEAPILGVLPNNAVVTVIDRVMGGDVAGNPEWLKVGFDPKDGFIAATFAKCTTEQPPVLKPPAAYRLPLECDRSARISQGNDGNLSHQGLSFYAFDFAIPLDTPLVAIADGIVVYRYAETEPGEACYAGGGPECLGRANYVVLHHGDGTNSQYAHVNRVLVSMGEFVPAGKPVALSGSTGYSTGAHAHVMRQKDCGAALTCQSIEVKFADVPGSGIPATGQTVTSKNGCP